MPSGKHDNHARGESHYRWSDEKHSSHGYVKVRVGRGHRLADPNGYAYEHLMVWCSAGNNRPGRDEVIHHKNGNKTDNRLENLELKTRSDHSVGHGNGLSNAEVLAMRRQYANGERDMPGLAAQYGIPVARVSKIIRGQTRLAAGGPTSTDNRGKKSACRALDLPEVSHAR